MDWFPRNSSRFKRLGLQMKILLFLFLSIISFAGDGTPTYQIWLDLGITQEEYYYLSGLSGLATGFIFSLSIILVLVRK
jgi:hypothetical protein